MSPTPGLRRGGEGTRPSRTGTDVVGIFPDDAALLRLASCVLIEAHDEWQVSDRRYLSEASMALLNPPAPAPTALPTRTTNAGGVIDEAAMQTA